MVQKDQEGTICRELQVMMRSMENATRQLHHSSPSTTRCSIPALGAEFLAHMVPVKLLQGDFEV